MNKIIYILTALPLLFASCSSSEPAVDESVQVTFNATLTADGASRGDATVADKVVCATFKDGSELTTLRQVIDIRDGRSIVYTPRLAKGVEYQVAFWAMKDGAYNATDMKNVRPADAVYTGDPERLDCFTNCTEPFTVTGADTKTVTLKRPMARINLGVTDGDLQAVNALGYTLSSVKLTVSSAAMAYNAVTGLACGQVQPVVMTMPVVSGEVLDISGVNFNKIASYQIFTEGNNVTLSCTIYGVSNSGGGEEIALAEHELLNVPVAVNKNTNIVGNLVTGNVNYTISTYINYDN